MLPPLWWDPISHTEETDTGAAAIEALGVGAIVVGEGERAHKVTPLAQRLLDGWRGITVGCGGRVRSTSPAVGECLRAMLAAPSRRAWSTLLVEGGRLVRVMLVRIRTPELSTFLQGPTVVVLLEPCLAGAPGAAPDGALTAALAGLYGLTAAEAAVLHAVAAGHDVAAIAATRGVSQHTVRRQLKDIFAKTGRHHQTHLVRLVMAHGRPAFGV